MKQVGGGWTDSSFHCVRISSPNQRSERCPRQRDPVHTHDGSEAFLVLAGEQTIRMPHGVMKVKAGQTEPGHGAGMPMQVSSSGTADLPALVMFVMDATKPFAPPAAFP